MAECNGLINECPLLIPQNKQKTVFDGFITVKDKEFRIRILLPEQKCLRNARLQCSWQLKQILRGYQHVVKQRLQHSSDLISFMLEFKTVLEIALRNRNDLSAPPPPQYYAQLIKEIESLGWDKLACMDAEFRTIKLKAEDSAGREHMITIKLKSKYPAEPPDCSTDFPVPFVISWTQQSCLVHLHSQFLAALESLQEFWDVMDEIDEKTWVLEPEKPARAIPTRRIAIGNNVSINVEVDPRHPKMLPECCFLGADHVVTPLRNKLNTNMHLWSPECTVLENLKNMLEVDFPSPDAHEKSSFSVECGICYAYRLASSIPDQVCDDPRCGQPFHQECLYEWLRGLPYSRQSFNVIFGECPYCNKPITVKMTIKKS
ncbi:E3 ubiquitin-protein ligase FANCL isoform X1 [Stegostoma tigrinum]|uniref:E3 ubiquitin-protein ligase FANCL isoform X1 n=1 Tax=Stegostoma tigrinum TaxID=3053191 RepID=UPI00202B68B5|nr:E3 ubiquitin-protein ligase FANCL isoform X1 [Stegostoma tigrinum]XP_059504493.1 E3 ubiquitin-protein ligase FANCL isoform X1 [Stegostoma tigrinum]